MSQNLEIERKFLIEKCQIPEKYIINKMYIVQIYLNDGLNGSQRRIRRITDDSGEKFFYTEKRFLSSVVREENETEISQGKFNALLNEKRADCAEINKKRIRFDYLGQPFELDIYPFSEDFAILELELASASQEIFFPDFLNIIKEVTSDAGYSNAALCTAGKFPNEAL